MTDRFPRPEKALYLENLVPGMELWEIIGHFFEEAIEKFKELSELEEYADKVSDMRLEMFKRRSY